MNQILTIEYPKLAPKFKSVAYGDGMPASAKWVREGVLAQYTAPAKVKAKATVSKTKVQKVTAKKVASKSVKTKSSAKKTSVKKK